MTGPPGEIEAILADDFLPNPDALEFVSFTFGYPDKEVVARVKESGRKVVLNATSIEGVRAAAIAGADRIVLQGLAAGGHRAFVRGKDSSDNIGASVEELAKAVTEASAVTDAPIIAAGGVGTERTSSSLWKLVRRLYKLAHGSSPPQRRVRRRRTYGHCVSSRSATPF